MFSIDVKIWKSNINLHKKYLRATPKLFSFYQTAINYYETMTERVYAREIPNIRANTLTERRNVMLTFVRSNKYKVGLNLLSNRLRAITNIIPKNCLSHSKDQFKTFCKVNLIQKGLLSQWIHMFARYHITSLLPLLYAVFDFILT